MPDSAPPIPLSRLLLLPLALFAGMILGPVIGMVYLPYLLVFLLLLVSWKTDCSHFLHLGFSAFVVF